ncbi:hypothetical protein [Ruminococcus sp.]|uniref:hypothetical protein n=1 Tax=Ruminococcus sp. TaxID=41978 RepID=UPI0025CD9AEF|nr:hypothetical protein [Ruminococcus sp.]MCR4638969.1 hypothetical protein [Ruminococcus sp.]
MGILYNNKDEAILYFDDENHGYVYADAEHKMRVAYFDDSYVYKDYNDAAWDENRLAKISLVSYKVEADGNECHLSDSSIYKIDHPFDERLGSYKGDFYGAAAAAAIAFLIADMTGSFGIDENDKASSENVCTETSSDSHGCLWFIFIAIFAIFKYPLLLLYKLLVLLFKAFLWYLEKAALIVPLPTIILFLASIDRLFYSDDRVIDGIGLLISGVLSLLLYRGMYFILKKNNDKKITRIVYSFFSCIGPIIMFFLYVMFPSLNMDLMTTMVPAVYTWGVFYIHKLLIPFITKKFKNNKMQ